MQIITQKNPRSITPRQMQILRAIAQFNSSNFYSPTIAELAAQIKISRSTIFEHIEELRKKNLLLASTRGRARSLKVTQKAHDLLEKKSIDSINNNCDDFTIPFCGRVAAGVPIEAIQQNDTFTLGKEFINPDNTFALEVTGDSMIEEGINDGDYVICKKASNAENGSLVIAIVDNENATLKRFYNEKNHARLQPANKKYKPICTSNCRIEALVIGLIRKF